MDKTRKKLLGECLVERGLVSPEQIAAALAQQKKSGSRLGQLLVELGLITEADLIATLAQQLNLAHIDLNSYRLKSEIVALIPESIARKFEVLALEKMGTICTIAMADPLNVPAIDEIQRLLRCRVEPVICSRSDLFSIMPQAYQQSPAAGPAAMPAAAPPREAAGAPESRDAGGDGVEVVAVVNDILRLALQAQATDIHIEPEDDLVRVRCRVDGFLREIKSYARDLLLAMISRIKVLANLDISEKRLPQDGRFQFDADGKLVDLRVSTLPTVTGEKVVMRILDKSTVALELERLGFAAADLEQLNALIRRPFGMILVTGPTSSGKTTTLYAALSTINTVDKNIITVEDPVEYRLRLVNQVQVNPRAGLSFATGLRSFLRQDPDVIMVGEIRDRETAEIAVQAALTGHLVLSTIHTNNAPSTITRLIDMKIDSFLIASAVSGILAQRLIRKICSDCRAPYRITAEALRAGGFKSDRPMDVFRGAGCAVCNQSGYRGRIGIYELMVMTDAVREAVLRAESAAGLMALARRGGMRTLREDGMAKVAAGITTIEEVLRATNDDAE